MESSNQNITGAQRGQPEWVVHVPTNNRKGTIGTPPAAKEETTTPTRTEKRNRQHLVDRMLGRNSLKTYSIGKLCTWNHKTPANLIRTSPNKRVSWANSAIEHFHTRKPSWTMPNINRQGWNWFCRNGTDHDHRNWNPPLNTRSRLASAKNHTDGARTRALLQAGRTYPMEAPA